MYVKKSLSELEKCAQLKVAERRMIEKNSSICNRTENKVVNVPEDRHKTLK